MRQELDYDKMWLSDATTSCAEPTKPLTLKDIQEAFEELERYKPEFHQIAMNQNTLEFLQEHGLNYDPEKDYWHNLIVKDYIPDDVVIGFENGKVKKIMKIDRTDT